VLLGDRRDRRLDELELVALDERVPRVVDSRKKRCVSSSTVSMRRPSSATMCTSTDDCFCHEHVRQTRGQKNWCVQEISSSAVMASKSRSGSCGGLGA
jgi:hypothetical protein